MIYFKSEELAEFSEANSGSSSKDMLAGNWCSRPPGHIKTSFTISSLSLISLRFFVLRMSSIFDLDPSLWENISSLLFFKDSISARIFWLLDLIWTFSTSHLSLHTGQLLSILFWTQLLLSTTMTTWGNWNETYAHNLEPSRRWVHPYRLHRSLRCCEDRRSSWSSERRLWTW